MIASLNGTTAILTDVASIVAILAGVAAFFKFVVMAWIKNAVSEEVGKSVDLAQGNRTMLVAQNEKLGLPVPRESP